MKVMGVTNHFLISSEPAPQERIYAWYYKSGEKPMAPEVIDPGGSLLLLFCYMGHVKQLSKHLFIPIG